MPRLPFLVKHTWKNNAGIGSRVFKKSPNTEPSDVIELTIVPDGDKPHIFNLNVVDVLAIIHCLSCAASVAVDQGSPIQPKE